MCFAVEDEQNLALVITETVDLDFAYRESVRRSISWMIGVPIHAIEFLQPAEG